MILRRGHFSACNLERFEYSSEIRDAGALGAHIKTRILQDQKVYVL